MKATIEELRNKFFEECVSENTGGYKVINYAPHDLFEWIKENIVQPEPENNGILPICTRVEVIDSKGRGYTNYSCKKVYTQMQDENRTLKIFID